MYGKIRVEVKTELIYYTCSLAHFLINFKYVLHVWREQYEFRVFVASTTFWSNRTALLSIAAAAAAMTAAQEWSEIIIYYFQFAHG